MGMQSFVDIYYGISGDSEDLGVLLQRLEDGFEQARELVNNEDDGGTEDSDDTETREAVREIVRNVVENMRPYLDSGDYAKSSLKHLRETMLRAELERSGVESRLSSEEYSAVLSSGLDGELESIEFGREDRKIDQDYPGIIYLILEKLGYDRLMLVEDITDGAEDQWLIGIKESRFSLDVGFDTGMFRLNEDSMPDEAVEQLKSIHSRLNLPEYKKIAGWWVVSSNG